VLASLFQLKLDPFNNFLPCRFASHLKRFGKLTNLFQAYAATYGE